MMSGIVSNNTTDSTGDCKVSNTGTIIHHPFNRIKMCGKSDNGKYSLVSNVDFEYASQFRWSVDKDRAGRHVVGTRYRVRLHQEIVYRTCGMTPKDIGDRKMCIHHIDGNKLNNCRKNLQLVTKSWVIMNRKVGSNNKSGTVGVAQRGRSSKWIAYMTVNGRNMDLGEYETCEEAAAARRHAEDVFLGRYCAPAPKSADSKAYTEDEEEAKIPYDIRDLNHPMTSSVMESYRNCEARRRNRASVTDGKYSCYADSIEFAYLIWLGGYGTEKIAIVSENDYEELVQYKWLVDIGGYAVRRARKTERKEERDPTMIRMHRVVMERILGRKFDEMIDHINGNKLDNRRDNLRLATYSHNAMNKGMKINNTSGEVGVWWAEKYQKWEVGIAREHDRKYLGRYASFDEAVEVRRAAEAEMHREYSARLCRSMDA